MSVVSEYLLCAESGGPRDECNQVSAIKELTILREDIQVYQNNGWERK